MEVKKLTRAKLLSELRRKGGAQMSTSYYLVQTEPTPLYGRAKVAQSSGGVTSPWMDCSEPEWVDADGTWEGIPDVTVPVSVADLKALVASGRYRLVDEYGEEHDVREVFGK